MKERRTNEETLGAPLVVCINDCSLDQGQPASELAPICFKLGCAFAEMRWKNPVENSDDMSVIIQQQPLQINHTRLH